MNALMTLALSNIAVATLLAMLAWAAGRWLRRPAITHGLWLLVFIKLLTPPLVSLPVIRTAPPPIVVAKVPVAQEELPRPVELVPIEIPAVEDALPPANDAPPQVADVNAPQEGQRAANGPVAVAALMPPPVEPEAAAEVAMDWSWLPSALGWAWLFGSAAWLSLALVRIMRFQRLLRLGTRAPEDLRQLAKRVAAQMDVRCPRLVMVPGALSPMLWVFGGRPRLVLPAALVDRLTPKQWRTLLAHELAHWRRRDHWVRWLELAALTAYWWCPLAWWAKRQLQEAEEECCDAWVVSTLPGAARAYALALVETVDFLSGARPVLPPAASGLGHVHLLQRRLTMILRGRTPRALTLTGLLVVLTLGAVLLPLAPTLAQAPAADDQAVVRQAAVQQQEKAAQKDEKQDAKTDADKARQDLQKLQDDFIKLQRQMDQRRRDFEDSLRKEFGEKQQELNKQMQEAMRKAGFPGLPGGLNPGFAPPLPPAGFPPMPPAGVPGAFPPGGLAFPGQPRPDLERRLNDLERKLDTLLEKLDGKAPNRKPADPNTPPSRNGAGNATPPAAAPAAPALRRDPAQPAPPKDEAVPRRP